MDPGLSAVLAVLATGFVTWFLDWSRRRHDADVRKESADQARRTDLRRKREETYQVAMERLRASDAAYRRMATVIYGDERGYDHPYSTKGTMDWAIDESEQLLGVQSSVDIFGSSEVVKEFEEAIKIARRIRWAASMPDYDGDGANEDSERFEGSLQKVLTLMRGDLDLWESESLESTTGNEQPT